LIVWLLIGAGCSVVIILITYYSDDDGSPCLRRINPEMSSGFAAAAVTVCTTFASGFCGALRIILKITSTNLATFSTRLCGTLGITGKITFTTSLLCHSDFLIVG
jgi:hypothetical protein